MTFMKQVGDAQLTNRSSCQHHINNQPFYKEIFHVPWCDVFVWFKYTIEKHSLFKMEHCTPSTSNYSENLYNATHQSHNYYWRQIDGAGATESFLAVPSPLLPTIALHKQKKVKAEPKHKNM